MTSSAPMGGTTALPPKPKRGRPPGVNSEQTRARLVSSARVLFAERGYDGAGIAELVSVAGVTAPVLYHHFQSKAGLYAAAMTEVYDIILDRFATATATEDRFPDKLHAMLLAAAELHEEDPTISMFVNSVPAQLTAYPELHAIAPQMRRVQGFLLQLAKASPDLAGRSPTRVAQAAAVVLSGMARISTGLTSAAEHRRYIASVRLLIDGELFSSS